MFLLSAKKEEVEAVEKEAKDKHEKEWEGERREKGSCIKSLALVSDNIEILDLLYKNHVFGTLPNCPYLEIPVVISQSLGS